MDFKVGDMVLIKLQPAALKFFKKVNKDLVRKYKTMFPNVSEA